MIVKKSSICDDEIIDLGDFSENYSFVIQDEVQSAHWNKKQSTLHPFVVYFKKNNEISVKTFCAISNSLEHNTVTFYSFQNSLMGHLKKDFPNIKKILYFSDGCAAQYKNKKKLYKFKSS